MSERATSISGFASARALLWIAIAGSLWLAIPAQGDVVILHDGRMYAGVVERTTSQSVELFDGNLRRIVSRSALKEIVHERLDTSWVIVGDQMARQSQWDAAAAAYRQALRATDQHDVVLRRLEQLRSVRFRLPGSEKAESLLDAGHYAEATTALSGLIRDAHEPGQRHYWTLRLAQAYVGLARRQTSDGA
ncbi:hypothetical protein FJY63_08100, partial [Candidatus Sumerlaeota bacterium]|nr:hypothetical protein [Candidatus Sumerlaeota bacterium]